MVIILSVCAILLACGCAYFYHKLGQEKKTKEALRIKLEGEIQKLLSEKIAPKDLEFLEFTVDMYVKYAKDLNIWSEQQHDYIVEQLERIRQDHLVKND